MRRVQLPALVGLEGGRPSRVSWSSGRAERPDEEAERSAARVIDEWRVDARWWDRELHRDYYLLELNGGKIIEIYREGERWCVTGVAD